jgi:hypothetical protein
MKHNALSIIIGAAIAFGLCGEAERPAAHAANRHQSITLSVAAKKSSPTRERRAPGQIACTVSGCNPIPPGCHPETGYNWDGIPTGFDIVVCRPQRRPRG